MVTLGNTFVFINPVGEFLGVGGSAASPWTLLPSQVSAPQLFPLLPKFYG